MEEWEADSEESWDWPKAATAQAVLVDNSRPHNIAELLDWVEREPTNFCRAAVDLAAEVRRLRREGGS